MNRKYTYFVSLVIAFYISFPIFGGDGGAPGGAGSGSCESETEERQKIEQAIQGLKVTVADSENCNGPGANGTFYAKATLPDFCGEYEVMVTVTGSVEIKNSGYDTITFQGELIGSGFEQGVDCGMTNVTNTVTVKVKGQDEVKLSYTTGDGLHHVGANAKVTKVKVKPRNPCSGGGSSGSGSASNGCLNLEINPGIDSKGRSAGLLLMEYATPSAQIITRSGINFLTTSTETEIVAEDSEGNPIYWNPGNFLYHNSDGSVYLDNVINLKQIKSYQSVIDFHDIDSGYEMRFYSPANITGKTGLSYNLEGEAFTVWRIQKMSIAANDFSKIMISEIPQGQSPREYLFEYNSDLEDWILSTDNGNRREIRSTTTDNDIITKLYRVENNANQIVYQDVRKIKTFPWGNETIAKILGNTNPKTTNYYYYDDIDNDGDNYGQLKSIMYANGFWERYEYDSSGRIIKLVSPYLNSSPDSPENECKVIETIYSSSFPQSTTITKVKGVEVARSYSGEISNANYIESHNIKAYSPNAAWDAPNNLVTITRQVKDNDSVLNGKILFLINPDQNGTINKYTLYSNYYKEISDSGLVKNPYSDSRTVVNGIRTETEYSLDGTILSQTTTDIVSGLLLSKERYISDDFGRTTCIEYDDGTSKIIEYGCCGPSREVERDGSETITGYDNLKRIAYTVKKGITYHYTYDAYGQIIRTTVQGKNGSTYSFSKIYDDSGEIIASIDENGNTTNYSNEIINGTQRVRTTNPDGSTSIISYYKDGNVSEISGTAVAPMRLVYDIENAERVTKTIKDNGSNNNSNEWTQSYYNFLGKLYKIVYSDNTVENREYDQLGRLIKSVSPGGKIVIYAYNTDMYDFVQAIDMNSNGIIDYDGSDVITASKSLYVFENDKVLNRKIKFGYITQNSDQTISVITDESVDGKYSKTNSNGQVTISEKIYLSPARTRTITTYPDGVTSTDDFLYGDLLQSVNSSTGTVKYTYDEFNRVSMKSYEENGLTKKTINKFDSSNQLIETYEVSADDINSTKYDYDSMGRVVKTTSSNGTEVYTKYDIHGNLISYFGNNIYKTDFEYDMQGRKISMTTYRNLNSQGEKTQWEYDNRGRIIKKIYADGTSLNYEYSGDGKLTRRVWARGVVTTYTYDMAGNLLTETYSDGTPSVTYSYDRSGAIVTITDASGTRQIEYDHQGNSISEDIPYINSGVLKRNYDNISRLQSIVVETDNSTDYNVNYQYSNDGRLLSVADSQSRANYTYRNDGRRISSVAMQQNNSNIVVLNYSYDKWENINNISWQLAENLEQIKYEYNNNNKRTKIELPNGDFWQYQYDKYSHISVAQKFSQEGEINNARNFLYNYDDIGNLKNMHEGAGSALQWFTTNNLNQYITWKSDGIIPIAGKASRDANVTVKVTINGISKVYTPTRNGEDFAIDIPVDISQGTVVANVEVNAVKFDQTLDVDLYRRLSGLYTVSPSSGNNMSYDADGNLLNFDGWTFTWNGENRLVKIEKGNYMETYDYDYKGRRWVKKCFEIVNDIEMLTQVEYFIYDEYKQIASYRGNDKTLVQTFVWSKNEFDIPLWFSTSAKNYFYVVDANKNIRIVIDSAGNTVQEYDYGPMGQVISFGDNIINNPYKFSSEYHDDKTNLVYFNYRYYSPILGRWINRDPIGEDRDMNLYVMVQNDTINNFDILGLKKCCGRDITAWFIDTMTYNGKVAENSQYVQMIRTAEKMLRNSWTAASANNMLQAAALQWPFHLARFKELVQANGPWDFKKPLLKMIENDSAVDSSCKHSLTVCGKCIQYETVSNLHFGYVARKALIDDNVAERGAGWAQRTDNHGNEGFLDKIGKQFDDPYYGDEPEDNEAIHAGYDFEKTGDLCAALTGHADKLKPAEEECQPQKCTGQPSVTRVPKW